VRLFGEADYDAYQRLKKLEILEPEVKVGYISHSVTVFTVYLLMMNALLY